MANAAIRETVAHLLNGSGKPRVDATIVASFSIFCCDEEGGHCELLAQHVVSAARYIAKRELTIVRGLRRHLESDVFQVVLQACVLSWYLTVFDGLE